MKVQPNISARNILVTGGGGYLGAVLVPLLLQLGHQVQVLHRCFPLAEARAAQALVESRDIFGRVILTVP